VKDKLLAFLKSMKRSVMGEGKPGPRHKFGKRAFLASDVIGTYPTRVFPAQSSASPSTEFTASTLRASPGLLIPISHSKDRFISLRLARNKRSTCYHHPIPTFQHPTSSPNKHYGSRPGDQLLLSARKSAESYMRIWISEQSTCANERPARVPTIHLLWN
jgi:hypothetical protein